METRDTPHKHVAFIEPKFFAPRPAIEGEAFIGKADDNFRGFELCCHRRSLSGEKKSPRANPGNLNCPPPGSGHVKATTMKNRPPVRSRLTRSPRVNGGISVRGFLRNSQLLSGKQSLVPG